MKDEACKFCEYYPKAIDILTKVNDNTTLRNKLLVTLVSHFPDDIVHAFDLIKEKELEKATKNAL